MPDLDALIEANSDAQAALAHGLAADFATWIASGETPKGAINNLAGECAIPTVQVERLLAFAEAGIEAQNGVLPEVYGEILRKRPMNEGGAELCAAAETSRWNVETAHAAVRTHRPRRRVESGQVRSALRQAETIAGGALTAEAVLRLDPVARLELSKPMRTVARYAGQQEEK